MYTNPTPALRRPFAAADKDKCYLNEGKFATLASDGSITVITAATTLPHGVVCDPDGASAAIAGGKPGATLMLHTFQGVIPVQLGASPGTIKPGTLLKVKADGTVMASSSAAGDVIVAMSVEEVTSSAAGQLVNAVLLTPYKVPAAS